MSETFAVEFQNVRKSFGHVLANDDVSFQVRNGTIHGIVGENGAGKSTAMNILFGIHRPDAGSIKVFNEDISFKSPLDAMKAKVGMVHQHFMLAENLTALDNLLLQENSKPWSFLRRKNFRKKVEALAQKNNFSLNLSKPVHELSVGEQQRIEILKVLLQDSNLLIFDEPTAVLTPSETESLFNSLRQLRDQGKTILIISHKLKEVLNLTDEVTVFRSGKVVQHFTTSQTTEAEIAEAMIGKKILTSYNKTPVDEGAKTLLEIREFKSSTAGLNVSIQNLNLRAGEILGIAGVEGNGQNQLIEELMHAYHWKELPQIQFHGTLQSFPEDRLRYGILPEQSAEENFLLGQHERPEYIKKGFIKKSSLRAATHEAMRKYDVRPLDPQIAIKNFSGGNQQKLVVAKALEQNPDIVLAAHPTRGVDIGAISFIHSQILKACEKRAGVLLISSELDELMNLSDRILVMYKGQIVADFERKNFNELSIGKAMGGLL